MTKATKKDTPTVAAKATVWACTMAAVLACATPHAMAQEGGKSSREREALRRVQQALRSAQEEASTLQRDKSQLAQEKAELAREKERAAAEAGKASSRLAAAMSQSRQAQARIDALEAEVATLQQALATEKDARTKQAEELAQARQLVATTRDLLARSTQAQRILEARNRQLYEVGTAMVEVYRSRKPAETLSRQEPFFNLGIVTLENISETWQDRLEAARFLDQDKLTP